MLRYIEAQASTHDVAHDVTYGGLDMGSEPRRSTDLPDGPVGGGQTAPAGNCAYFGPERPARRWTASAGPLLNSNRQCRQS